MSKKKRNARRKKKYPQKWNSCDRITDIYDWLSVQFSCVFFLLVIDSSRKKWFVFALWSPAALMKWSMQFQAKLFASRHKLCSRTSTPHRSPQRTRECSKQAASNKKVGRKVNRRKTEKNVPNKAKKNKMKSRKWKWRWSFCPCLPLMHRLSLLLSCTSKHLFKRHKITAASDAVAACYSDSLAVSLHRIASDVEVYKIHKCSLIKYEYSHHFPRSVFQEKKTSDDTKTTT